MKKLLLALLIAVTGGSAHGIVYKDTNIHDVLLTEGANVTDTWYFTPLGPGLSIKAIEAIFVIYDGDDQFERIAVRVGLGDLGGSVDFLHVDDYNINGEVDLSFFIDNNAGLFLDAANGSLRYNIASSNTGAANDNNFTLKEATVKVYVPDSGMTLALLLPGLAGLAALRRKLAR